MNLELLKEMISCVSPSGKEEALQKCVYNHYKDDFDDFEVGDMGTLTGMINFEHPYTILLAAHADEISLCVNGYNSDGSLTVTKNGGIRAGVYVGSKVSILTPNGIVKGVVGFNDGMMSKEKLSADDLFIDLGCTSKEEAEKLVPKGSYVVHDTEITELQNDMLSGRAFDDRAGVYVIFEAAKRAKELGCKNCLCVCATTGEETTGRGAFEASSTQMPDVCITVDVTYANDYHGVNDPGDIRIGKGGVICRGSIPNAKLNALLEECAKELDLPVQEEVWPGRTATDADTMLKTGMGIPQVLFSIPLRYMHSPIEVLSMKDLDSMVEILARFLVKLDMSYDLRPYTLED